jgi:hypothetical protein
MDKDPGCLKARLLKGHIAMRATTLLNNLLDLPGVNVDTFSLDVGTLTVGARLRRKRLVCPEQPDCGYSTRWRVDTRKRDSS